MPYWCPECEEEIDHLNYNSNVNEWGSHNLRNGDEDCHDSETQETEYECPHCDHSVSPDDVLEDDPHEDDEVEENTEMTLPTSHTTREPTLVNEPSQRIISPTRTYSCSSQQQEKEFVECSKCKRQLSITEEDKNLEEIECNCKNIIKIK